MKSTYNTKQFHFFIPSRQLQADLVIGVREDVDKILTRFDLDITCLNALTKRTPFTSLDLGTINDMINALHILSNSEKIPCVAQLRELIVSAVQFCSAISI